MSTARSVRPSVLAAKKAGRTRKIKDKVRPAAPFLANLAGFRYFQGELVSR